MTWSDITKKNLKDIINEQLQSNTLHKPQKQNIQENNKMEDFFFNKDNMNEFDDMYYFIYEYLQVKYNNNNSNQISYSYPKIQERNKLNKNNNYNNNSINKEKTFKFMTLFELHNPFFFSKDYQKLKIQNNRRIDLHGLFVKEVWVLLSYLIDNKFLIRNQEYIIITGKGNHSTGIPKKQFSDIKYKNNKIINQIEGTYYNKLTKATLSLLEYYKIKHKYEEGKILI